MAVRSSRSSITFILKALRKEFPGARTALEHGDPFQLLIATILSAQCTDERVNKVTPDLFRRYPTPKAMSLADPSELEAMIRSTGFFRMKTKNIMACSSSIVEHHGGVVPSVFESLIALPGVGRKTANCVMGGAFGINSGIVVDTHVQRLSGLLGLTKNSDPVKIESDLKLIVPQKDWYELSNLLILHGRKTCIARWPRCSECSLLSVCPAGPKIIREVSSKAKSGSSAARKPGSTTLRKRPRKSRP